MSEKPRNSDERGIIVETPQEVKDANPYGSKGWIMRKLNEPLPDASLSKKEQKNCLANLKQAWLATATHVGGSYQAGDREVIDLFAARAESLKADIGKEIFEEMKGLVYEIQNSTDNPETFSIFIGDVLLIKGLAESGKLKPETISKISKLLEKINISQAQLEGHLPSFMKKYSIKPEQRPKELTLE